jgi:amino acid transporter
MMGELKRLVVGRPLSTEQQQHERLSKVTALAVFSSDALSSVAYATEAILAALLLGGLAAGALSLPIAAAIVALLLVVGFSYRQTIHAYPSGGGAYIVAHENLGEKAGVVAAASLLIDYVLTVAVSISAGVAAITSLAGTWGYVGVLNFRVEIALACILVITMVNLRGVKESGAIFSVPTYLFVFSILAMVLVGVARTTAHAPPLEALPALPLVEPTEAIGLWLVLQAFAAGCTALTGVEAISNGVPAFRKPESRNAATTLTWMVLLLGVMFLGITWLASAYGALPNHATHETVVSQIARSVFGSGPLYGAIQIFTALILVLAANTAYQDFPRLSSLLAKDRFLPRQFASRGDRLVFSNGILALGFSAALLVVIFRADEIALLPLYAIGVFLSFTLSQGGMVRHWLRFREPGWRRSIAINGFGAVLTSAVLVVLTLTKFTHGAWAVLVLIPLIVLALGRIRAHYRDVAQQLSLENVPRPAALRRHTAIVLVSGVHRGVLPALQYAASIAPDNVTAVYVDLDGDSTAKVQAKWREWGGGIPLVVLESPYRSLTGPLLRYIDEVDQRYDDDMLTIIMPEFVPRRWWQHLLHNQTGLLLKTALLFKRGKVVTSVPYHLER